MFRSTEKGYLGEVKIQIYNFLLPLCSTHDNTQYCYFFLSKTVKQQFDFPSAKQSNINHRQLFSVEYGYS